jgi:hypothetical protein
MLLTRPFFLYKNINNSPSNPPHTPHRAALKKNQKIFGQKFGSSKTFTTFAAFCVIKFDREHMNVLTKMVFRMERMMKRTMKSGGEGVVPFYHAKIQPWHGATLLSHDAALLSHDATLLSHDATLLSHGATLLSHGAALLGHGTALLSHDATLLSHGATLLSRGAALLSHGAALLSRGVTRLDFCVAKVNGGAVCASLQGWGRTFWGLGRASQALGRADKLRVIYFITN